MNEWDEAVAASEEAAPPDVEIGRKRGGKHAVRESSGVTNLTELSLLDFIPAISPHLRRPDHMADWAEQIERTLREPVRALNSKPTRHHKTTTTLHGAVYIVKHKPHWRVLLIAEEHTRAEWLGEQTRILRDRAGIERVPGLDTKRNWSTPKGGGVTVISANQSGLGIDSAVVMADDPIGKKDAEKPEVRDAVDETIAFYTSRAITPDGRRGSVLINMSRFHPDDPIGRRVERGWEYISSPAIINEGVIGEERAFAPNWLSLEDLKAIRDELAQSDPSGRTWHAQWQNDPLPDVLGLFGAAHRYVALPGLPGFRYALGADLAFSPKKRADYFALAALKIWPELLPHPKEPARMVWLDVAYVVNMWRERWDPSMNEQIMTLALSMYPGASIYSYMSGPEIGTAHYLSEKSISIEVMHARFSKRVRAQRTIDLHNAGRIRYPESAPWVRGFLQRQKAFSGAEYEEDDDEIDAEVSAIDGGMGYHVAEPTTAGRARGGVVRR